MKIKLARLIIPLVALTIGLCGALTVAALLGENPFEVLQVLFSGALGSRTELGYSLYYATPLMLTGLSVAWAFRAGLFNIGAEGQMTLGGVALAAVGVTWPNLPTIVALPCGLLAAFLAGGLWAAIAGWMKARRGCHEVLSTILLNFIAYGLASFFILTVFKNPISQVPETSEVGSGFQVAQIPWLGGTSPLSYVFFFSITILILYALIFRFTRLGFYQKLAGGAPELGRRAGIRMDRQILLAMFISGGLAGLAAAGPVLGFAHKTREGFTSNIGFIGIAVALLGRNSALGVLLSALLFGVLTKGALDLDLDTKYVSRDLATVIQALIVIAVASHAGLAVAFDKFKQRRAGRPS